jgi:hypothetical protein
LSTVKGTTIVYQVDVSYQATVEDQLTAYM